MNMVDLERLKEKEDAAIKIIDSWPRIFQLLIYRQLYAHGIRISNIDSEIAKELMKGGQSQERAYLECDSAPKRTPTANLRKVQ